MSPDRLGAQHFPHKSTGGGRERERERERASEREPQRKPDVLLERQGMSKKQNGRQVHKTNVEN